MLKKLAAHALTYLTKTRTLVGGGDEPSRTTEEDEESVARIEKLHRRVTEAERMRAELFDACLSLEKQRNQWQRMYHQQAREHTAAQELLGTRVAQQRAMIISAYREINRLRAKLEMEPFKFTPGNDFEDNPLVLAQTFLENQKKLLEEYARLFGPSEKEDAKKEADASE